MGLIRDQVKQALSTRNVGIVEFAESSEFVGKPLFPRQRVLLKLIFLEEMEGWEEDILDEWMRDGGETRISPLIRERRDWLRENGYFHFPETILIGGRRSSKGFVTAIAGAKKIYDVWRLGDPGKYFTIDSDKEIYFSCVAAAMDQAKKYQFADLISTVTRCKSLRVGKVMEETFTVPTAADQQYLLEMKNRGIKVGRDFSKLRGIPLAANADTLRGSATIFTVFDEMCFMMEGESRSSAAQCYAALKPSLDQFGKWAMVFNNSSPAMMMGQCYDLWKSSHEVIQLPDGREVPKFNLMFSLQFPSWELYKDYEKATWHIFEHALMVSPDVDISKLSREDADLARSAREEELKNPETFKVERRGQWAEVQNAYLNPEAVDDGFLPVYQGRFFKMNTKGGTYVFSYKGHCDPSNTTAGFGFAIAHVEQFNRIKQDEDGNSIVSDELEPHVVFDVVQRWSPQDFPNGTIDWRQVIGEIAVWCELFPSMREFTFDQFNSAAPIQQLQQTLYNKGLSINVGVKTATNALNIRRWEDFKSALNQRRVHIPPDCPDSWYAAKELKFLQFKNGKVDHQTMGEITTKDIADCICECTYYLMNSAEGWESHSERFPIEMGLQGGFAIGQQRHTDARSAMNDIYRSLRPSNPMNTRTSFRNRRTR
jgi:hypothetical protein